MPGGAHDESTGTPAAAAPSPALVSVDRFITSPVGSATASPHALFWMPERDLLLISVWGRLDAADFALFEQISGAWLAADAPRRRSVLDLRRLIAVEPELMARFAAYVVERRATYLRTLGACGLIVEPSALLTAAVIAGLPTMADAPSPFRAFSSIAEALIAFGADGALAITFEALQGAAAAEGALLQALAEWLRGHLHDASVAGAARALAVSVRTLQRQLNRLGTSFRREQERARVAAAQSLLMNTDDKVQVIAVAVGLEKAQHLALLFRRWTGMSPAAWRAERRGGVVEGE